MKKPFIDKKKKRSWNDLVTNKILLKIPTLAVPSRRPNVVYKKYNVNVSGSGNVAVGSWARISGVPTNQPNGTIYLSLISM